jgi:hypothetical protein
MMVSITVPIANNMDNKIIIFWPYYTGLLKCNYPVQFC